MTRSLTAHSIGSKARVVRSVHRSFIYDKARSAYYLDDQSRIKVAGQTVGNGAYVVDLQSIGNQSAEFDDDLDAVVVREPEQVPVIRSIAEAKAKIVADMVDHMVDRGRDMNLVQSIISIFSLGLIDPRRFESHHLITYTLTSLSSHRASGCSR